MKTVMFIVLCCMLVSSVSAQPTSAPATAPVTETLMKGDITFTPPDGWKLDGKANNDRLAKLSHAKPLAVMVVNVDPQQAPLGDSAAPQIGQMLIGKIRDNAKKGDFELLEPAKAEKDDRFFLRIHHKFRKGTEVGDQLQIYRSIGKNLVAVAITVFTESPEESKKAFADAEQLLVGVNKNKPGSAAHNAKATKPATRPTMLHAAKIIFNGPAGWTEETNDNATGIVASYHDPVDSFNTIVISVRPLPPEAKKDPKMRDALVEEVVKGESTSFKFDGAQTVGDPEVIKDRRFLKKVRIHYEKPEAKIQVTSRTMRIGDQVVTVAMACLDSAAAETDKLADDVAVTLRAAGR